MSGHGCRLRVRKLGLFHGFWLTLDGKPIRRIRRDEFAQLYRLWHRHTDIRLGVRVLGMADGRKAPK